MLVVRILLWTRFFCNVHLFRVPHSWTDSVQMKSSMTFIRGNMCIEREIQDTFNNGREVKRLKECALALRSAAVMKEVSVYYLHTCFFSNDERAGRASLFQNIKASCDSS